MIWIVPQIHPQPVDPDHQKPAFLGVLVAPDGNKKVPGRDQRRGLGKSQEKTPLTRTQGQLSVALPHRPPKMVDCQPPSANLDFFRLNIAEETAQAEAQVIRTERLYEDLCSPHLQSKSRVGV